ncbi:MAG TPA: DUF4258 domain-containing protein [Phycisphaerae bacterium]|jgi:hypothetical protein
MDIIAKLLSLLLRGQYEFTQHALEELDEDNLTYDDVLSCFASGSLRRAWRGQRKYEVQGRAIDGRGMRVIARLIGPRRLRIITAHVLR